jgi:hypothetical protein
MRPQIMYIEDKSSGLVGPARIGRVHFSKTGATLTYAGRSFQSLKGSGFKANYFDVDNGDHFWISGPRRDGADGLYGRVKQADDVNADVADEYWRDFRGSGAPTPTTGTAVPASADCHLTTLTPMPTNQGRKHRRVTRSVNARISQVE